MRLTDEQKHAITTGKKALPNWAVKPDNRRGGMTSITPQYVIDRLNYIFGYGGWTLEHTIVPQPEFKRITTKDGAQVEVANDWIVVCGQLVLNIGTEMEFRTPMTYGGNNNVDVGDRYKGAVTDLLTKSAQFLEIAHSVFIGEYSGDKYMGKLDEATSLAAVASPGSRVILDSELLKKVLQLWLKEPEKMSQICKHHDLELPADNKIETVKLWIKANAKDITNKLMGRLDEDS